MRRKDFWKFCSHGDECWEWQRGINGHGYGSFYDSETKKHVRAHRMAWLLTFGPIPTGEGYHGTEVCHSCDNKKCVRPEHLFLGTHKQNMEDAASKGLTGKQRSPATGLRNGMHSTPGLLKLSVDDVREIRRLYSDGVLNQYELAENYGVSQSMVSNIVRGKAWTCSR